MLSPFSAIFLYDYILTFGEEVDHFWERSRRRSWASVLFMSIRYITLLGRLPAFMVNFLSVNMDSINSASISVLPRVTLLILMQWLDTTIDP